MAQANESRGSGVHLPVPKIGLPARPFLWTPDQIATVLMVETNVVLAGYLFFEGRSTGSRHKSLMVAVNIAPADAPPEWRITEREFTRWMRFKGFRFYERASFA